MSFEMAGKLHYIFPVTQVSDSFRKREFILEKIENINGNDYTDHIKFQLTQDRCGLVDAFQPGEQLQVQFNIRGRKWEKEGNVNYFTNLEAWKISRAASEPPLIAAPLEKETDSLPEEPDDLPF